MPSIRCPNCGKRIDAQTPVCPYCGHGLCDNFFKVILPSYNELGNKAPAVAKYIASMKKIEVDEAIALLQKGRIVIKKNASFEQAQRISQNFAKSGIKVIVVDARLQGSESKKSSKKKKGNKLPLVLTSIFLILAVGTIGSLSIYHHYFMNLPENMIEEETLQNISSDESTPSEIAIPDISNISASAAEQILINSGLVPVIEEIYDDDIIKGNVIESSPAMGSSVPKNSRVTVYVSKGSLHNTILTFLDEGKYDEANKLLCDTHVCDWATLIAKQIQYEQYSIPLIKEIKNGLKYPESFLIHEVDFCPYETSSDENAEDHASDSDNPFNFSLPACIIRFGAKDNDGENKSYYYALGSYSNTQNEYVIVGYCYTLLEENNIGSEGEFTICSIINDIYSRTEPIESVNINRLKSLFTNEKVVSVDIASPSVYHSCDSEDCTNEGAEEYLTLYGKYEYYCTDHFEKMLQTTESLENRTELGILGEHTCEECETVGMHSIIGISGEIEYYCTKHYRDIRKTLNVDDEEALKQLRINHVVDKIAEIGEVTLESEAAILAAQEAFDLLSESEAEQVHNHHLLEEATSQFKSLWEAQLDKDIANAVSKFNVSTDKVSGRTIYKSPAEPYYADTRCFVLPQLVVLEEEGFVGMRLTFHYTNDSWLFFDKVTIYVDGEKYYVNFDYGEVNRDNDSGDIWEWAVIVPTFDQKEMLQNIADSSETIVRFHGDTYYDDFTMNSSDKQVIRDFLVADELLSQKYTDLSSYVSTSP